MGRGIRLGIISGIFVLALALRLKGIFNPLLDDQAWRQADTATIALNMSGHLTDFPAVFFPHLNYDGIVPQKVELEFPFLPYLLAWTWSILGWSDVWGRLWSVLFSLLTIWGIYDLARRIFSERVALLASGIYAVFPLAVYYGRVIMPEPVAQALSIWALNLLWRWRCTPCTGKLCVAALLISGAILAKLPQLMLFPVALSLGFWPLRHKRLRELVAYSFIALFFPVVYYSWVHFGSDQTAQFVSGIFSGQLVRANLFHWVELRNNLHKSGLSLFIIVLTLAGGIRLTNKSGFARVGMFVWLLVSLFYVGLVCSRIPLDYYLVPVLPLAAILSALAIDITEDIPSTVGGILLVYLLCCGTIRTLAPKYTWDNRYLEQAEWLNHNIPVQSVLILSDPPPMTFYYTRRAGYRLTNPDDQLAIIQLKELPAQYLVRLPKSERKLEFWENIKKEYPEIGPGVYWLGK